MFPETVETASLELWRAFPEEVDALDLYDRFASDREGVEAVFEYVPQEPYATPHGAVEDLADARAEWDDHEVAEYAVFADGDDLAGRASLVPEWDRQTGRLGLILAQPYWGRGYAAEVSRALAAVAFEDLDLDLVAIGHEAGNERSKRAIERFVESVGGQSDGVLRNWTPVGEEVLDHHRYTVSREAYRAADEDSGNG